MEPSATGVDSFIKMGRNGKCEGKEGIIHYKSLLSMLEIRCIPVFPSHLTLLVNIPVRTRTYTVGLRPA